MTGRFHPLYDNPVRMGYVPGWRHISDLIERVADLEQAVGESRVVPAPWEPFSEVCLCGRYAGAYAWAQAQLRDPSAFAVAFALFPGDEEHPVTHISRANWLILATKGEPSPITRTLMLVEALELWEAHPTEWLEQIVRTCGDLGVTTSVFSLYQQVQQALLPLRKGLAHEEAASALRLQPATALVSHGFDKELLQVDAWTPDPGLIVLPVDGKTLSLKREILRLDLHKVVLLKSGQEARSVPWEKVTLVGLFDGAVTFEVSGEPPLTVAGYKHPDQVHATVRACYKAATERLLQAVATHVTHIVP